MLYPLIKATRFLIIIFLISNNCFAQKTSSQKSNNATREETIDWLISKIKFLNSDEPCNKFDAELHRKDWCETTINGTILNRTGYYKYTDKFNGNTEIDSKFSFDFSKFTDYEWKENILILKCNSCVEAFYWDEKHLQNSFQLMLNLDAQMQKRFTNALDHLKKLSVNNKEKF